MDGERVPNIAVHKSSSEHSNLGQYAKLCDLSTQLSVDFHQEKNGEKIVAKRQGVSLQQGEGGMLKM